MSRPVGGSGTLRVRSGSDAVSVGIVNDASLDEWDEEDPRKWSDAEEVLEPYCDLSEPEVCESCQ